MKMISHITITTHMKMRSNTNITTYEDDITHKYYTYEDDITHKYYIMHRSYII